MFFSRDVRFNENRSGLEKEICPIETTVELDLFNNRVESGSGGADAGGIGVGGTGSGGAGAGGMGAGNHGSDVDSEIDETVDVDKAADGVTDQPAVRRSARARVRPEYYTERITMSEESSEEPCSFEEAVTSPCKVKWEKAMEEEIKSLDDNVWELVEPPAGWKIVGSKWVYKIKHDGEERVQRYKARLVAQGYTQKRGAYYDETFSPVITMESLRTVVGLAARNGLKLHQLDVTAAFLNGGLEEEVFMQQPEGFILKGQEQLVCKLRRSIYGLKLSPRCWNFTLDSYLKKIGFLQSISDPCIYIAALDELAVVQTGHLSEIRRKGSWKTRSLSRDESHSG